MTDVVIAGAGIGGLTAALCLVRSGFNVTVLEQAGVLREVGAGVQISANGARVLHELGLAKQLAQVGFKPERGEVRHWLTGETLLTRPLGSASEEQFGYPYYHLHRADLHALLAEEFERLAPGGLRLGVGVSGFRQTDDGVVVETRENTTIRAGLLIGSDGIHSSIRAQLHGDDAPRFTGCVAWRTTIPVSRLPRGHVRPVASNWLGQGGHFVHYYVRGGELVNCVGVLEQDAWIDESWSQQGSVDKFMDDFSAWHPDLRILIENADQCFRWGLFDRNPLPFWSAGCVTLLGDACHPMLPFMAQGAVMAIEDGYVLAQCLLRSTRTEDALDRYETLRRERTAIVQQMSRENVEFFHNPDVEDLQARLGRHRDRHLWLYGYDVTTLEY